jgi:hypothetical protein
LLNEIGVVIKVSGHLKFFYSFSGSFLDFFGYGRDELQEGFEHVWDKIFGFLEFFPKPSKSFRSALAFLDGS